MERNQAVVAKEILDSAKERPIVERPNWLWDKSICLMFEDEREQAIAYIEHIEGRLDSQWRACQEKVTGLEAEIQRLTDAIREKDKALEVCADRRWEAEERVAELMDENVK